MDTSQLITAIEGHHWQALLALVLLAITALAGDVCVRAKVRGRALQVVSLVRGYVGGVAAALLVGGVWWHALIVGVAATGVSAGARDLLVDAVKWAIKRHGVTIGALLVVVGVASSGCQGSQVQPGPCTQAVIRAAADIAAACWPRTVEQQESCERAPTDGVGQP